MKKKLFIAILVIISIFTVIRSSIYIYNKNKPVAHVKTNDIKDSNYIKIDSFIKADWSNMTTYVYLYNPDIEDLDESVIEYINIDANEKEADKNLEQFSDQLNNYVNLINQKYDNRIKVVGYKKTLKEISLFYEDNSILIWDYDLFDMVEDACF